MTSHAEENEVARALDEVRRRVCAQAQVTSSLSAEDQALSEMQTAIQDVNVNSKVNAHLPLLWEDMLLGRLRAYTQRLVRRLLRWYINPIVDQQNTYNGAVARALTLLAADNARLRREQTDLSARLTEIEKRIGHING